MRPRTLRHLWQSLSSRAARPQGSRHPCLYMNAHSPQIYSRTYSVRLGMDTAFETAEASGQRCASHALHSRGTSQTQTVPALTSPKTQVQTHLKSFALPWPLATRLGMRPGLDSGGAVPLPSSRLFWSEQVGRLHSPKLLRSSWPKGTTTTTTGGGLGFKTPF